VRRDIQAHALYRTAALFSARQSRLTRFVSRGCVERWRDDEAFENLGDVGYQLPLAPDIGDIDLGATYAYTGERRTAATSQSPNDMLPAFSLLNLNINWNRLFGSPFDISLFGTNVLDKEYSTYYSGSWKALGFDTRQVGQPRMYGARLRYNFGT
jgi:outer membrane receptor protein involved in Fe transport